MPTRIMAIAAHPGDALFTMGATVAQHIHNGGSGVFLSLSLGEKGHRTIAPKEYGEMQRTATEKAARLLGAGAVFLTYPDAEIPATDAASLAVGHVRLPFGFAVCRCPHVRPKPAHQPRQDSRMTIRTCALFLSLAVFATAQVKTGLDVLIEQNFKPLEGKRVGLATNQTGITRDG